MRSEAPSRAGPGASKALLLAMLAVAVALRAWEASESSLWLDELHTLFHAGQPSLRAVAGSVARDNHTPLYFWLVHLGGALANGVALRWISIAASLGGLLVLLAWLREAGASNRALLCTAWLYAVLPYQVHYGAELRPYALLALFSIGALASAYSRAGPTWARFVALGLCAGLGLLTHRSMVLALGAIFATRVLVRARGALPLRPLILGGVVAALPFLPWLGNFARHVLWYRIEQLDSGRGLVMGDVLRQQLPELPLRLVEPFIGSLGPPWNNLARVASVLFAASFVAVLVLWCVRRRGRADDASTWTTAWRATLVYAVLVFAATTVSSWLSWDRVPLQYYAGMAWAAPVLLAEPMAAVWERRLGRVAVGSLAAAALAMGIALAGGVSRARVREGIRCLVAWGRELEARGERPLYTARMAQPGWVFPDRLPYDAYAPDVEYVAPDDLPRPGDPDFERPVLAFGRALPVYRPKWEPIRTGRRIARQRPLDAYIRVYEWRPVPSERVED